MKGRIIFYNNCVNNSGNSIFGEDIIFCQFIIPMCRYLHFTACNQVDDLLQRFAHRLMIVEQASLVNGGER